MVAVGSMGSRHENSHHIQMISIHIRISAYIPSRPIAKMRDTSRLVLSTRWTQFDSQQKQQSTAPLTITITITIAIGPSSSCVVVAVVTAAVYSAC
jgi:hypothetical protein